MDDHPKGRAVSAAALGLDEREARYRLSVTCLSSRAILCGLRMAWSRVIRPLSTTTLTAVPSSRRRRRAAGALVGEEAGGAPHPGMAGIDARSSGPVPGPATG